MSKFLADENIAPRVIKALKEEGYDVKIVKQGASDEKIITQGLKENRIILTHDKDFGNLLEYPLQRQPGVVLIRLRNQSPNNVTKTIIPLFKKQLKEKFKNALIVVNEGLIRIIK